MIAIYQYKDEPSPSLEEAQKMVGGNIQVVVLPNGDQIVMDEEGLFKDYPVNKIANELWGYHVLGLMHGNIVHLVGSARLT